MDAHREVDGRCRCGWEYGEQAFHWTDDLAAVVFTPEGLVLDAGPAPAAAPPASARSA